MTCFCIGPQNGDPVCPCEMRELKIIDGRYIRLQDLGLAPKSLHFDRIDSKPMPVSTKTMRERLTVHNG